MTAIRKWADEHQYDAQPLAGTTEHDGVLPSVKLFSMSSDPLGEIASFNAIYRDGREITSSAQITDDERKQALEDVQKTHLKAPLEAIKMHFVISGVDRAFTHQHVRQRTAVYAQESMRFAVMGDLLDATTLPPSLAGTARSDDPSDLRLMASDNREKSRRIWDDTIRAVNAGYHFLVGNGVPAEEARGLLPHATATRLHYVTDLRNLSDHAGNRLCTQAQFHWRLVFASIMDAIANYTPDFSWAENNAHSVQSFAIDRWEDKHRWQFKAIAESGLFRPACYQLNYCPFEASFDRSCTIRARVQERSDHGNKSEHWHEPFAYLEKAIGTLSPGQYDLASSEVVARVLEVAPINVLEWLANPAAARKQS